MALRDIILYPHEVLTRRAAEVDVVGGATRELVADMVETMYDAPGIGLAAPQVGVLERITVIDVAPREDDGPGEPELHVFINPEIVHREGAITWEEGCLSIPGIYEKVHRAEKIVVQALDANGEEFELEADGLLSVCIQHEIDHLDGVVFLQHLSGLKRRMALKRYKKLREAAQGENEEHSS
ncbi:MAG: peptide deformylase [Myxococcota bacterium]